MPKTGESQINVNIPSVSPATNTPGNFAGGFMEGLNLPSLAAGEEKKRKAEAKDIEDASYGKLMVRAMDEFSENERRFMEDGLMTPGEFEQNQRIVRENFVRGAIKNGLTDGAEINKRLTALNSIYSELKAPSLQTDAQGVSLVTDRNGNTRLVGDLKSHAVTDILKVQEHFPNLVDGLMNDIYGGTQAQRDIATAKLYDLKAQVSALETAQFNAKYAQAIGTSAEEKAKLEKMSASKLLVGLQQTAQVGMKQQLFNVLNDYAAESSDPDRKAFFQNKDLVRATLNQALSSMEGTEAFMEYKLLNGGRVGDEWRAFKEDYTKNMDQFLGAMDMLERKTWDNNMKKAAREGMVEQYIQSGGESFAIMLGLQGQGLDRVFQSALALKIFEDSGFGKTNPTVALASASFAQQDFNSFSGILQTQGNVAASPLEGAQAFESLITNVASSLNAAKSNANPMHQVTTALGVYEKVQALKASPLYSKFIGTGKFQPELEHQFIIQLNAIEKQALKLTDKMDANTIKRLKSDIDEQYQPTIKRNQGR